MNETASAKYRKRPVVIEAHQWFKNGDHPEDYAKPRTIIIENGEVRETPGEYAKERGWEGGIVRYFRHPDVSGADVCGHCGRFMLDHGWIDTLEGGHTVCPGDWIITGIAGERYPCKPDIFAATYEPAAKAESDRTNWLERRVTEMEQEIGAVIIGRDQSDKIAATANTEAVRYMREREDAKAALALTVKILSDSEFDWRTKLAAANAALAECAQKNAALMKAIKILKPDPDEAKEVEQMRDLLRRADHQLACGGFGEQWPLRLAIKKALSVAPYQGRFGESEPPSSTGRCTCDGCDKSVGNAWRDSDGYHCLTCLAKQRDDARTEAARLKAECERGTCAGAATMGAAVEGYRDNLNGVISQLRAEVAANYERISWLEQQREVECQQKEAALAESEKCLAECEQLRAEAARLAGTFDIEAIEQAFFNHDHDGAEPMSGQWEKRRDQWRNFKAYLAAHPKQEIAQEAIGSERPEPGTYRAGDHVHHKPTGEDWVVACDEEGGKIMPSGWPCCLADAADCSLLKAATDSERLETLQGHAKAGQGYEGERDPRTIAARRQLAAAQEKGGQ